MIDLIVEIEISGLNCVVGKITGNDYNDARFSYTVDYLQMEGSRPISLSLPLQTEAFSVHATSNFFEGLLPEGFIRKCVAKEVHADTNDYLNILAVPQVISSIFLEFVKKSRSPIRLASCIVHFIRVIKIIPQITDILSFKSLIEFTEIMINGRS